jgi:hypothetical protein
MKTQRSAVKATPAQPAKKTAPRSCPPKSKSGSTPGQKRQQASSAEANDTGSPERPQYTSSRGKKLTKKATESSSSRPKKRSKWQQDVAETDTDGVEVESLVEQEEVDDVGGEDNGSHEPNEGDQDQDQVRRESV